MANLKEALQYASQNPNSDFAKFLTDRIVSGEVDVEAQELGLNLNPIKQKYQTTQRIERLTTESQQAEQEAQRVGGFFGQAKTFGKEFVSRLGEISGITPTAERIAAGIAPYVVPDEELPDVVEELVGGVETPEPSKIKELGQIALDLPLIGLGLSKNVARAFEKQAGKMTFSQFAKYVSRPLIDFLPESIKKIANIDVGTPIKEAGQEFLEKSKQSRIDKLQSETDEAVGKIIQGKPEDVATAKRALSNVDTSGTKTYSELNDRITEKVDTVAKQLDTYLDEQTGIYKKKDLDITTQVGNTKVKQNYVDKALKQLKELYLKIEEPESFARIKNIETKLNKEGLTARELNDLSREYGREFGRKAFSKMGDPLTSVNAQAYENVRKGIKGSVRGKIEGDLPKELDKQMSDLLNTRILTTKMEQKVNALYQRVQKRGLFEKLARKLAGIIDVATLRAPSGFLSKFYPSNVGLKTMNSIDIENQLSKNLSKIEQLMKIENEDTFLQGVANFLMEGKTVLTKER